jgi:hypothetical protein
MSVNTYENLTNAYGGCHLRYGFEINLISTFLSPFVPIVTVKGVESKVV